MRRPRSPGARPKLHLSALRSHKFVKTLGARQTESPIDGISGCVPGKLICRFWRCLLESCHPQDLLLLIDAGASASMRAAEARSLSDPAPSTRYHSVFRAPGKAYEDPRRIH